MLGQFDGTAEAVEKGTQGQNNETSHVGNTQALVEGELTWTLGSLSRVACCSLLPVNPI